MPTTTKGLEPQKTSTQQAANVVSKGQPAQGMGPLLGAGGASLSTADDAGTGSGPIRCTNGHPVDVLTGDVVDDAVDVSLPGIIPVTIGRSYSTAFRGQPSLFGTGGWVLNMDQWIESTDQGLRYRESDGRFLDFPSIEPGSGTYVRSRQYQFDCTGRGNYRLTNVVTGIVYEFARSPGSQLARLRRIVDPRSNHIDFHYDGESLSYLVDTAGRRVIFRTDANGRVIQIDVEVNGQSELTLRYGYHPDGELAWAEDALGHRDRFEYDGAHRMVKSTLKNGVSFYYRFDAETGKCVKTWGDGGLHEYEFLRERTDEYIQVTTIGTEEPRVHKFNFAGDLIESATFGRTYVEKYVYDADHYLLSKSNAAGETTVYEYDARGNRTKTVDAAGNTTIWEYEFDRSVAQISPDGLQFRYTHDGFGRPTGVVYPTGAEHAFEYDEYGRLISIFGTTGVTARFAYDDVHNLVEEQDARGASWRYTYDALGRPLTRTSPTGAVTCVAYDAKGQPVHWKFPDGSSVEYTYEPLGNPDSITDTQGNVTRMQYGGTGTIVSQLLPDKSVWRFHYDTMERLRSIKNPKAELYDFIYDRVGRVEQEQTFDGRVLNYSYDASGRLLRIQNPDGSFRRFQYDSLGNVLQEDTPHGPTVYERDGLGRLLAATVIDGPEEIRVAFTRDKFGRVIEEKQGDYTLEFAFGADGRRLSRNVPGCGKTRYHYDVAGALSRVEHDSPSGLNQELQFERDILGREVARASSDGLVRVEQAYDSMNRLVEQRVQAPRRTGEMAQKLLSRNWTYDSMGRVLRTEDSRWGTARYQYDGRGQLTRKDRGHLHEVFEYQVNGSLDRALNELVPDDSPAGPSRWDVGRGNLLRSTDRHQYKYDRCHRRTAMVSHQAGETTEYVWDCRDRLREVLLPDGRKARYFYDAFGRRVRKEVTPNPAAAIAKFNQMDAVTGDAERHGASDISLEDAFGTSLLDGLEQLRAVGMELAPRVTHFLWDGDELAAELDSETGSRGHLHYPGTFVPLMQIENDEVLVVVTDHLGVPRELVGADGSVRWSADHTAWGIVDRVYNAPSRSSRAESASPASPFRLLGHYYDAETGLSATRFRMWDADTGRWLSPDPLEANGGANLLGLNGSPSNVTDPLGLIPNTATWEHRDANGALKDSGYCESGRNNAGASPPAGPNPNSFPEQQKVHTEGKILYAIEGKTNPGDTLTIRGRELPCTMCGPKMRAFAATNKMTITYISANGVKSTYKPNGTVEHVHPDGRTANTVNVPPCWR